MSRPCERESLMVRVTIEGAVKELIPDAWLANAHMVRDMHAHRPVQETLIQKRVRKSVPARTQGCVPATT